MKLILIAMLLSSFNAYAVNQRDVEIMEAEENGQVYQPKKVKNVSGCSSSMDCDPGKICVIERYQSNGVCIAKDAVTR